MTVPSYLYKVVYHATIGKSWVHWQANSPVAVAGARVSYDEFVGRTGMRVLPED